jgi:hypothetical protein
VEGGVKSPRVVLVAGQKERAMIDHEHTWSPVPLRCGRYACACGAQGYRARGGIRVARRPTRIASAPTARGATMRDGGQVRACPTLDEQERR